MTGVAAKKSSVTAPYLNDEVMLNVYKICAIKTGAVGLLVKELIQEGILKYVYVDGYETTTEPKPCA